jgi:hypothetical protein
MFDVSMTEVMVVVTGAGLLLGRREITYGSKILGWSIGKLVGSLQGIRMKYEEKTHGTQLHKLHRSVKEGLVDMSSIGTDLNALSGRGGTIGNYARQAQQQQQQAGASAGASASAGAGTVSSQKKRTGGILGSNAVARSTAPSHATTLNTTSTTGSSSNNMSIRSRTQHNFRLAQLILADDVLNKEKGPASRLEQVRVLGLNTDDEATTTATAISDSSSSHDLTGSDLVESSICESIVQESYAAHAAGHVPAPLTN